MFTKILNLISSEYRDAIALRDTLVSDYKNAKCVYKAPTLGSVLYKEGN